MLEVLEVFFWVTMSSFWNLTLKKLIQVVIKNKITGRRNVLILLLFVFLQKFIPRGVY